jgi:hypothetical protein
MTNFMQKEGKLKILDDRAKSHCEQHTSSRAGQYVPLDFRMVMDLPLTLWTSYLYSFWRAIVFILHLSHCCVLNTRIQKIICLFISKILIERNCTQGVISKTQCLRLLNLFNWQDLGFELIVMWGYFWGFFNFLYSCVYTMIGSLLPPFLVLRKGDVNFD